MKSFFAIIAITFIGCALSNEVGNTFLGSMPLPDRELEASNACIDAVTKIQIVDSKGKFVQGTDPLEFNMEIFLDQDLEKCYKGQDGQTQDALTHRVYFTSRDNEH